MGKKVASALAVTLILSACVSVKPTKTEPPKPVEPTISASEAARNSLDYAGTYRAKLACADCEYTMAQLQLNAYGQYRYIEQGVKNNQPIGQRIVFQGRYTWDKSAPIIRLLNARNMHFFVAENEVVLLSKPVQTYAEAAADPKFQKVVR